MKARTLATICGMIIVMFAVVGGAWGASLGEVRSQAPNIPRPVFDERTIVWVPLYVNASKPTGISYSELCLAGDRVRRMNGDGTSIEMGKAPASQGYTVLVFAQPRYFDKGDEVLIDREQVTIPDCTSIAKK